MAHGKCGAPVAANAVVNERWNDYGSRRRAGSIPAENKVANHKAAAVPINKPPTAADPVSFKELMRSAVTANARVAVAASIQA